MDIAPWRRAKGGGAATASPAGIMAAFAGGGALSPAALTGCAAAASSIKPHKLAVANSKCGKLRSFGFMALR
jgi:hypothetical protein